MREPRHPRQLLAGVAREGDSSTDFDPEDVLFQRYDSVSGPGTAPPRRTPVGPPRRDPIGRLRRDLLPDTPFSGSLVPIVPAYPGFGGGGGLGLVQPNVMTSVSEPALSDDNDYCVLGDQSMINKWRGHSRQRIALASWFGMPVNLAFVYDAEQFDGGGTWKAWHNLSAVGQTGGGVSFVSGHCVACVGDTEWSLEARAGADWETVARVTIPEGHNIAFSTVAYVSVADLYRPLVGHVFPIGYFEGQHKFVGIDYRVRGEGGQHRYFVEFRRPVEGLQYFSTPYTASEFDNLGLLPDQFRPLKPDPVPPDPS
jgi:hypothetical protein